MQLIPWHAMKCVGSDIVVGIVTHYKLDCLGIESQLLCSCPDQPNSHPVQWVPDFFSGVQWPGSGIEHPHPSCNKMKERESVCVCFLLPQLIVGTSGGFCAWQSDSGTSLSMSTVVTIIPLSLHANSFISNHTL